MEIKKLNEIIREILSNTKKFSYQDNDSINQYLRDKNLDDDDMIHILDKLIDNDIFRFLYFIPSKIIDVASPSGEFISIIIKIIKIIKNDMAQGPFIDSLIEIGEKNSNAKKIYAKLVSKYIDEDVYHYAGLLLGGVGRKDPSIIKNVTQILKKPQMERQLASLVACIHVIFDSDKSLKYKSDYENLLRYTLSPERNERIRLQAVIFFVDYYKKTKEGKEFIEIIFKNPTGKILGTFVDRIHYKGLDDHELEFELINKIADQNYEAIVDPICYFIASKNNINKAKSFEIIKKLILNKGVSSGILDYSIQTMAKINEEYYKKKFISLIKEIKNVGRLYGLLHIMDNFSRGTKDYESQSKFFNKLIGDCINKLHKGGK